MIERAVALLLLNALWEPLAIAACAFAVLRIARRADAATRCGVLTAAIAAALLLPIVTTAVAYRSGPASVPASAPATTSTAPAPARPVRVQPRTERPADAASVRTAMPALQRPVLSVPQRAIVAIVALWAAIACVLLARLLVSLRHLSRLRRDALPIAPDVRQKLARWSEKATGIDVRLCLSDETVVPIAAGLFDCMVLIPRRLLEDLDADDLDRIVLHEIAHLRRRDGIVYAMQQITAALYFFSPGVAWLSKSLDIEREVACDDWVLERSADAAPYANCLVRLAESVPWPHKALAAPGAFVTRHSMSIRIERILQHARDARLRAAPGPVAAAIAAAGMIAAAGATFAPSLAYPATPVVHPAVHVHRTVAVKPKTHVKVTAPAVKTKTAAVKPPAVDVHVAAAPAVQSPAVKKPAIKAHAIKLPVVKKSAIVARATSAPTAVPTDDYISQMRSIFGSNLSVEDLVDLKSVGVTPEYVAQMRSAGFGPMNVHQIIDARSVGLTPQRVADYKSQFGKLSFDDLMALSSLGIDAAYRREMQAAGITDLSARRLIELKSVGVTPQYIRQADAFGFGKLSAEQLVELRSMDIDADYLQRVKAHGFNNLTLRQIVELKSSGVIK